jgi:antirestriction protein ArdC
MGASVYEIITERILEKLSAGIVPWRQPWSTSTPKNLVSGKPYRGVNVFLLGSQGYSSPYWCSYKQALAKGGQVRKGEKGTPIIFWKVLDKVEEGKPKKIFILRYFTGFHVSQCDGLEVPAEENRHNFVPLDECERLLQRYQGAPALIEGGDRACYVPSRDVIMMPQGDRFSTTEEFYSTLFHELTHSSGASHRLSRDGITNPIKFASHDYSFEELVAEMGAAFLCGHTGIDNRTLDNSAAYIKHWSAKLRDDHQMIIKAGSAAQKAVDYIMGEGEMLEEEASETS